MKNVEVLVKGQGSGRETAIEQLKEGFEITAIQDITSVHNGCRLQNDVGFRTFIYSQLNYG